MLSYYKALEMISSFDSLPGQWQKNAEAFDFVRRFERVWLYLPKDKIENVG